MSQEQEKVAENAGGPPPAEAGADHLSVTTTHIENQIEQLSSFKDHLTGQLDALRAEGARLLEKQKALAEEKAGLAARQSEQEAELAAAREELARRRAELEQLAQATADEKAQMEKTGQDQRATLERRGKELERWERTIVEEEERVLARQVALASELEKVESRKQKAQEEVQIQDAARSAELEAELARVKGELETQNAKLKTQNAAEGGRVAELERDLAKIREEAEKARQELVEWEKEFETEQAGKAQEWATRESELVAKARALEEKVAALEAAGKCETRNAECETELEEKVRALEKSHVAREERITALEAELVKVESRKQKVEKELAEAEKGSGGGDEKGFKKVTRQRSRLIVAARRLRGQAQQMHTDKREITRRSRETARQEQVLKAKAENLEQVKRLMEKQELIMSRKLANHAAIKTVAAVGIFMMMLLGMSVGGVYWLVPAVYHSEAVVQLTALPADAKADDVGAALKAAAEQMTKSEPVLNDAWGRLRQDGYGLQDSQGDWAATFGEHLTLRPNVATRSLTIAYNGPAADSVAAVCNDLGTAFVESTRVKPAGKPDAPSVTLATLQARAVPPLQPVQDNRMKLGLSIAAGVMFLSLLGALAMRHFVRKQMKSIDHMAEEADWEQMKGELAGE